MVGDMKYNQDYKRRGDGLLRFIFLWANRKGNFGVTGMLSMQPES